MIKITEKLYKECWEGADSALATTAFVSGQYHTINKLAAWLADQPATYENAVSEYTWKERLIKAIEQRGE
jgi:hypothetical protein